MRNLYIVLFYAITITKSFSQTASSFVPKVNNIPTSPEAAMLGRFGDIPVGYYTGTANISIPLYSISESGIEIPIVLSYHSGGIKVADEATWVGLGWNLEPEGTIIQEVRGIKDQYDTNLGSSATEFKSRLTTLPMGTYKKLLQLGIETLHFCSGSVVTTDPSWRDSAEAINGLLQGNAQPDIYHYSFAGYSGSFYIVPETGDLVKLNQNDNVVITKNGGFTATTPEGVIFQFGATETAYSANPQDNYAGETNKLTSIIFPNGKAIIFSYTNSHLSGRAFSQSTSLNYGCLPGLMPDPPVTWSGTNNDIKMLHTITTDNEIITFNTGTRDDINVYYNDTGKKLESIDIRSNVTTKKIKSFQFNYSYFDVIFPTGTAAFDKRLKLDSVKEIGYSENETADNSKPAYLFSYDTSITLPPKTSYAKDFWGYYNGQTANWGLLPNLDFFEYPHEAEFVDLGSQYNPYFKYNYTKNNRFTDHTKTQAYVLKKITYPTGGYTEFEYEPNSYKPSYNQYIPDIVALATASKLITKGISNVYSSDYYQNFTPNKSATLYFHNTFSHGFPLNSDYTPNTSIIGNIYNNAKIILSKSVNGGASTIIKTWMPSDFMTLPDFITAGFITFDDEIWSEYQAGAQYKLAVYYPVFTYPYSNQYVAQSYAQLKYYDTTGINTAITSQAGLRIKTIKSFTSNEVLASYKLLKYINEDGTASGKLLNKFQPLSALESFCNQCTGTYNNGEVSDGSWTFKQVQISGTDFGTDGGTIIGYDRVEEIELAADGIGDIGKKVFSYNNYENKTKKGFANSIHPLNGLLKTEQTFNRSGSKLLEKTYTYTNAIAPASYDGVTIIRHCFGVADLTDFNIGDIYTYSYQTNPLDSYWYRLTGTTTKEYFTGFEIASTQNFTYNTNGDIRTQSNTFATGDQLSTTYYYPGELPTPLPIEATMVSAKMTGVPVASEQYKGSELLSRSRTEFSDILAGIVIMPRYIYSQKGGDALEEKRITFNAYDERGNILQYTLENGTPVTYLWGYNSTLPVAKIENANYYSIDSTIRDAAKNTTLEPQLLSVLASLRATLPDAMVTTYTYKPGVGVSTITDSKGTKISYEYDNFGRLKYVKDKNGNLLSENEYNFRP